jgi:hypothetical protein
MIRERIFRALEQFVFIVMAERKDGLVRALYLRLESSV